MVDLSSSPHSQTIRAKIQISRYCDITPSGGVRVDQEPKWCLMMGQQAGSRTIHVSEMLTCSLQIMLSEVKLTYFLNINVFLPLLI